MHLFLFFLRASDARPYGGVRWCFVGAGIARPNVPAGGRGKSLPYARCSTVLCRAATQGRPYFSAEKRSCEKMPEGCPSGIFIIFRYHRP